MSGPSSLSRDGICCSGGFGVGEPERLCAAVFRAEWVDLGIDAIADQVLQDVTFEEGAAGVVVFAGGRDQLRQPMGMRGHPAEFAGLE